MTFEEKKKIVIDNFFRYECNINMTIKEAYVKGFERGLSKVLKEKCKTEILPYAQQWIPISERLPEERKAVLVCAPKYKKIYCAILQAGGWWVFGAYNTSIIGEVVAWMPLPEPYKAVF